MFKIFFRVVALAKWGSLVSLISAAITIFQFWGGEKDMIANILPSWVWLIITIGLFIVSMVIGVHRYKEESEKENDSEKRITKRKRNKIQSIYKGSGNSYTAEKIEIHHHGTPEEVAEDSKEKQFQDNNQPVLCSNEPIILSGQLPGRLVDKGVQYRPYVVLANFYNKPSKIIEDSTAKKVHADVAYHGADMNNVLGVRGQWAIEGEWKSSSRDHYARRIKRDLQPLHGLSEVDFRPDSESQSIYLAIRHYGEAITYAISSESFDYEYLQHPLYVLKEQRYYIHVVLRPENAKGIERWYVLSNGNYLDIQEIEKPRVLLFPFPRENGKYVSLKVINNNHDEPIFCQAIMKRMERFEQDPTNINGGRWIPVNTDENGPLSWHHGGTDNEGYKKVHISPEFINIAKIPDDMSHLIRGNFIFTFMAEKPYKIGRYKIWVDVIYKTGDGFKKETWIGCIDMTNPMYKNDLTMEECEDAEDWKQKDSKRKMLSD